MIRFKDILHESTDVNTGYILHPDSFTLLCDYIDYNNEDDLSEFVQVFRKLDKKYRPSAITEVYRGCPKNRVAVFDNKFYFSFNEPCSNWTSYFGTASNFAEENGVVISYKPKTEEVILVLEDVDFEGSANRAKQAGKTISNVIAQDVFYREHEVILCTNVAFKKVLPDQRYSEATPYYPKTYTQYYLPVEIVSP